MRFAICYAVRNFAVLIGLFAKFRCHFHLNIVNGRYTRYLFCSSRMPNNSVYKRIDKIIKNKGTFLFDSAWKFRRKSNDRRMIKHREEMIESKQNL